MSDLEPRRRGRVSRSQREQRAYTLVLSTGGLIVLTIALVVLAAVGIVGGFWAFLTAILAAASGFMLRRTLNP